MDCVAATCPDNVPITKSLHVNGVIQFAAKAIVPVGVAVCFALAHKYLTPSARLSRRNCPRWMHASSKLNGWLGLA